MRTILVSFSLLALLNAPAVAQTAENTCPHPAARSAPPAVLAARRIEREACAADAARLCANVPRGCGRAMQCLRAHASERSASCTSAMAQLRAAGMQSR